MDGITFITSNSDKVRLLSQYVDFPVYSLWVSQNMGRNDGRGISRNLDEKKRSEKAEGLSQDGVEVFKSADAPGARAASPR